VGFTLINSRTTPSVSFISVSLPFSFAIISLSRSWMVAKTSCYAGRASKTV
jgi:hypothetical protein